jgi:peptidoglycan/LPS O-acetylase OafA/YrhL
MSPNNNTLRIAGLDGLRGIAVLSVVCHHLVEIYAASDSPVRAFSGGFIGVDLFFVISGFLITWLALLEFKSNGRIDVPNFYMRRALRLLPALLFFLLVQIACALFQGGLSQLMPSVWASLLYYLNWKIYFTLEVAPGFGHLWSLSIEEQFYMLWPLCLLILLRLRLAIPALALLALAVMLYRNFLWYETGSWLQLYLRTDLRLDALVLGALCAFLWRTTYFARFFSCRFAGSVLFLLFIAMTFLLDYQQDTYYQWGASFVALLGCGLIFNCNAMAGNIRGGIFNLAWLEYLGRRSYGMYLWHFPIFLWCSSLLAELPARIVVIIAVALSFLVTEFSWRVIEKPFNQRRSRFSYRADKAAV